MQDGVFDATRSLGGSISVAENQTGKHRTRSELGLGRDREEVRARQDGQQLARPRREHRVSVHYNNEKVALAKNNFEDSAHMFNTQY